jgi:nucleotide-binding universal stress UspA family protein
VLLRFGVGHRMREGVAVERIIVGVDFSDSSERAARHAVQLAQDTGATLHLVTATRKTSAQMVQGGGEAWHVDDVDSARQKLRALAGAIAPGVKVECAVLDGDAAKALTSEAERIGADVIVVGNKRVHGVGRVLGAVALDVIRHAPCAVHIAKTT